MIAAEERKVLAERIVLYHDNISFLNDRIINLDSIIKALRVKDQNNISIQNQMLAQRQVLEEQKGILFDQVSTLNKRVRKQKRKTFFTALAGIAATAGVFFIK